MSTEFDIKDWVVSVLRRASYKTLLYSEVRKAAKVPVPIGYPNKRLKFLQHCKACEHDFPMKETQVDHIKPVVPVSGWTKIESGPLIGKVDFNPIIYNLLEGLLQVLCRKCHKKKSKQENAIRRTLLKMYELTTSHNQNINDWEKILFSDLCTSLGLEKPKKVKRVKLSK